MISAVARDFERTLHTLEEGRQRIRIAPAAGLFRRDPGRFFHASPELFFQTGGGTDFSCPGGDFRLRTGDLCVMPTGVPHGEVPVDLRTPYEILVCMQSRDGVFLHRARASDRREIHPVEVDHFVSSRARAAFRYLEEFVHPVPKRYRRAYENGLLKSFLITVLGELHQPTGGTASRSPLVAGAEMLARTQLGDPELSVARLAASLGCSADYLSRRFHKERGLTLTLWMARERVTMARDLLTEPRYSIAEVGWMCGFSTPSYFIRVFRQQTGLTPRVWRENQSFPVILGGPPRRPGDAVRATQADREARDKKIRRKSCSK